jgi:hypothetical protein
MELVNALRVLARRRVLVALGVLIACAIGAAASGYLAVGPLASPELRSAIATAEVQVDTARPLGADVRASAATIDEQAIMLAERLAADDTRTLIAQRAGVPVADLTVVSTRTAIVGRQSAVARAAVDAASSTTSRYRLTLSAPTGAPIISVVAAAPDRATAARLAAAAAPAVGKVIADAPDSIRQRLQVEQLAPPRTAIVASGGPTPLLGVLAALVAFVGWCWVVVVAGGLIRRAPAPAV